MSIYTYGNVDYYKRLALVVIAFKGLFYMHKTTPLHYIYALDELEYNKFTPDTSGILRPTTHLQWVRILKNASPAFFRYMLGLRWRNPCIMLTP